MFVSLRQGSLLLIQPPLASICGAVGGSFGQLQSRQSVKLFHSRSACTLLLSLRLSCMSNFSLRFTVLIRVP